MILIHSNVSNRIILIHSKVSVSKNNALRDHSKMMSP